MRNHFIVTVIGVLLLAGILHAQTRGGQVRDGVQFDVNVISVDLMVSVTDNKGKLITNLKKEDFKVYEDGKIQTIRSFSKETDLPLSIALLIDSSNSVIDKLTFEKAAATDFLFNTIKRRKDRATVISFAEKAYVVSDKTADGFSDDPAALSDALKSIRAVGPTAVFDAVYKATQSKLANEKPERRKLIILISDGDDTASAYSREEALEMAQRHDVAIYSISTNKTSDLKTREQVDGDTTIHIFADETGGKSYFPLKLDDLALEFRKIEEELRSQYVLSYTPTNSKLDGTLRKIRIEMVDDKYKARTRQSYYASTK